MSGKHERMPHRREWIATLAILLMLAGLCLIAGRASARPGEERTFYAKVIRTDAQKKEVEVELMVQPAKTRLVFEGDAQVEQGDVLNFTIKESQAEFGGARLRCKKVIWVLR